MANEEKIQEITKQCVYGIFDERDREFVRTTAHLASVLMAQWKDQQFKEFLEKNRTNYPDFMNGTDVYAFGMKEGYVKAFDKIINELFKDE